MNSEERLREKLKKVHDIKDNDRAVEKAFGAFGSYYGEKAEESSKKANVYLGIIIFIFVVILMSVL